MSSDVDEPVFAWHERAGIAARAFLERLVVGAVDEHHVHAHAGNANTPDRLSAGRARAVARRFTRNAPALVGERRGRDRGRERLDALLVLRCELVLFPLRIERRERVLPLPDEESPGE